MFRSSLSLPSLQKKSPANCGEGAGAENETDKQAVRHERATGKAGRLGPPGPVRENSEKGGSPAAGSPTATLLRLHPSHETYLGERPPRRVELPASGIPRFHGVTGGVYKTRERIHRGVLIRDY